MNKQRPIIVAVTIMLFSASLLAQAVRVNNDELPQPVLKAVEKQAPGSTFGGATKQTAGDGTVKYTVNLKQGEERLRLIIAPDGRLYERSESAKFSDLPGPVKKEIEYVCSGEPDTVTKVTPGEGHPIYKFGIGRLMEEDGSPRVKGQDDLGGMGNITREEVPQSVLKAIATLAPGVDWFAVRLGGTNAKYGTSYMIRTSNRKFFVISPDGQLNESWDMNVNTADLPAPIRKIAQRANGAGEETLIRVTAVGKKPYYRFALSGTVAEDGSVMMEHEK